MDFILKWNFVNIFRSVKYLKSMSCLVLDIFYENPKSMADIPWHEIQKWFLCHRKKILSAIILPVIIWHFFPKLLRNFKSLDFSLRRDLFRAQINLELKGKSKNLSWKIPKIRYKILGFFSQKEKTNKIEEKQK